ncbi:hypothetical protein CEXT_142701 [Caerostris extrusa]|uniref:Uncharacterized protein n=1 Tax=Caerostris extrusa TaxID=172846 RepID=A0AAV4UMV4_CAEEX|nr:hypothetical protein CEXT_142701 [Caerostris extrusa]
MISKVGYTSVRQRRRLDEKEKEKGCPCKKESPNFENSNKTMRTINMVPMLPRGTLTIAWGVVPSHGGGHYLRPRIIPLFRHWTQCIVTISGMLICVSRKAICT